MNKKAVILLTILVATNIICIGVIGFQNSIIKNLEKYTISLIPGALLPDLEITPVEQPSSTESKKIKLFFVFKSPCSACNANLNSWKRLAQYFEGKIEVQGVILDGRIEAKNLMEKEPVNFPLYVPENIGAFKEKMHIRFNLAHTIIASDNKVKLTRIGTLEFNDIEEIIMIIKNTLKGV